MKEARQLEKYDYFFLFNLRFSMDVLLFPFVRRCWESHRSVMSRHLRLRLGEIYYKGTAREYLGMVEMLYHYFCGGCVI